MRHQKRAQRWSKNKNAAPGAIRGGVAIDLDSGVSLKTDGAEKRRHRGRQSPA